jgi:hypothetical protein
MAEQEKRYGCPSCGNQDVRQRGRVEIESNGYFMLDQRGQPEFLGYEDPHGERILWHTFEPLSLDRFVCCECHQQFDQPAELDQDAKPLVPRQAER